MELFNLQVEERAVRADSGSRHIASGSIQQGVYASVSLQDVSQILLQFAAVHHVGSQEHGFSALCLDVRHDGVAYLGFAAKDNHFGAFFGQIGCDGFTQYAGSSGDNYYSVSDVK